MLRIFFILLIVTSLAVCEDATVTDENEEEEAEDDFDQEAHDREVERKKRLFRTEKEIHGENYTFEDLKGSQEEVDAIKRDTFVEKRNNLREIFKDVDENSDKFIQFNELLDHLKQSVIDLNIEEAMEKMSVLDVNNDEFITWEEYLKETYGYTPAEVKNWKTSKKKELRSLSKKIYGEREKYKIADEDKDKQLDILEFSAFYFPQDYKHMKEIDFKNQLKEADDDDDGKVSFEEFVGIGTLDSLTETERKSYETQFDDFDRDDNKFLNPVEARDWLSSGMLNSAEDEAQHLFKETDRNKDGKLSDKEVMREAELWVGSSVGEHLEREEDDEEHPGHDEL